MQCPAPAHALCMQIIADYEAGLEYAEAVAITDARRNGDAKEYRVRWSDGSADTWESEDYLTRALVATYESGESAGTPASSTAEAQAGLKGAEQAGKEAGEGAQEAELAGVGQ